MTLGPPPGPTPGPARADRPTQSAFAGMPTPLYAASPSRLLAWLDCPRRYRMAYLDRPRPPTRPHRAHTSIGLTVHTALRDWWDLPPAGRSPAGGAALVERGWVDVGFRDARQSARWRERTAAQVAAYLQGVDPTATPAGTERTVAFKTQTLSLFGRVDRLDDRAGTLVVVDYKTSRRAPTEQDARTSLPLALYAAAVWKMFRRRCVRVELHHVPSGAVAAYEHSDESLVRKVREAESLARDLRAVDRRHTTEGADADCFAPRLSPLCLWCDYRAQCREGQLAGPEKSSWAALEESTDEPGIDADRTGPDGPEWDGSAEPVEDAPLGSDSAG